MKIAKSILFVTTLLTVQMSNLPIFAQQKDSVIISQNIDSSLQEAIKQTLLKQIEDSNYNLREDTHDYYLGEADLNDDGIKEVIVFYSGGIFCSNRTCPVHIFQKIDNNYHLISPNLGASRNQPNIAILSTTHNGWHDLATRQFSYSPRGEYWAISNFTNDYYDWDQDKNSQPIVITESDDHPSGITIYPEDKAYPISELSELVETNFSQSLKPGEYTAYNIQGTYTGLMRADGSVIGNWDNKEVFDLPSHTEAALLWFSSGWISWDYNIEIPNNSQIESLSFTAEIASEAPGYNSNYPSEVIVNINGIDIGSWIIPGDPGDQFGYQKNHLGSGSSQYGWLTTWTVDNTGTYLEYKFRNGDRPKVKISNVTINDIEILPGQKISVKLSIPGDKGLNIFGNTWGDYSYDPTLTIKVK